MQSRYSLLIHTPVLCLRLSVSVPKPSVLRFGKRMRRVVHRQRDSISYVVRGCRLQQDVNTHTKCWYAQYTYPLLVLLVSLYQAPLFLSAVSKQTAAAPCHVLEIRRMLSHVCASNRSTRERNGSQPLRSIRRQKRQHTSYTSYVRRVDHPMWMTVVHDRTDTASFVRTVYAVPRHNVYFPHCSTNPRYGTDDSPVAAQPIAPRVRYNWLLRGYGTTDCPARAAQSIIFRVVIEEEKRNANQLYPLLCRVGYSR